MQRIPLVQEDEYPTSGSESSSSDEIGHYTNYGDYLDSGPMQ
jgi:hypothetical protein